MNCGLSSLLMKIEFFIPKTFEAFHKSAIYPHFSKIWAENMVKCIFYITSILTNLFMERIGKCNKINLSSGMGAPIGQGRAVLDSVLLTSISVEL